ncbi:MULTISPECIES: hypothetical protein [unclassified Mesorhizobium]|uniref:hypothetical protein n=1 Tax=unclassified Mesorhizobium TaxID=325217 RepID=UPI000FCCDCC6|nr:MULTISPECIES: hypothetical protein [unclassified Mesorhizobium]TGP24884.1 hypothetical protein EN874_007070 [Mesorhizobium sp. M1D.F.Ca.ET.231.01.1.1]TGP36207.1 hypothetical protein EN877_07070 [Mesorhizobium sp. M1D.F.Ca.ET.234.01.1.1]TGS49709.1 hypothetical protein EN827_07070 [Mesorhizobium sp. M1D.F.Ca.ET.184.01.1.1]TGS64421.1 hypothetical protein EN826_007070 [Mesorhizobium sp. M1D.F.Ca.ET.183.01.1.1]
MFGFLRRKPPPEAPQFVRVPGREFSAAVGAAMHALTELQEASRYAKARLSKREPIVQADLEDLLHKLAEAKERIECDRQKVATEAGDEADTLWDRAGYDQIVAPTLRMGNSPQEIVDLTLTAADNGAKSAKLLYELVIAEMEVAIARHFVTMNSHLRRG